MLSFTCLQARYYSATQWTLDNYTSVIKKTGVGGPNGFWGAPQYLCSGRLQGKDLPRVRKLVAWRWKTGDGELVPPIEPPVLASIAARHPIALLGDSLNHELFTSLVGLLASQKPRVQSGKSPHLIFPSDANRNATVSDFEMEVALEIEQLLSSPKWTAQRAT